MSRDDRTAGTRRSALSEDAGIYRALLDAAPDPLLVVDESGTILFANVQTERVLGYAHDELLGQSVEILIPVGLRDSHRAHRESYQRESRQRPMGSGFDLIALHKDGSQVPVEISLSPLRISGALLVSAAIRDITPRVTVENELRRARAAAEQASAAKSRFLAAASHDLRQPLQAAVLYNNVLERQLADTPQAETAAKLRSSLVALRDLLNRLLDVSRLEAGAISPEIEVLPLRILFERLYDEFAPQAQEKGVVLRMRPGGWRVRTDPQLLEQLLRNLVSNALRYTEKGRVLVGCRRSGAHLRIQVCDTGIGIAEHQLEVIFDEFYQVSNPERLRKAGLGLGLAIVRGLSQLLDHPVTVRSGVGRGSLFEVRVPLSGPHGEIEEPKRPRIAAGRARVAVLDDDAEVLDGVRLLLEELGHEVMAAPDAESLLRDAQARRWVPEVILSDYRLGGNVTGAEAISRLRRELGGAIAGILFTGDSSSDTLRSAQAAGFAVLYKPIDPERLAEAIGRALLHGRESSG